MALPPSPMPPPGPAAGGAPPDMMGGAGPDPDAGNPDEETENEVIATICRSPDGKFLLYAGDEPEEGEADGGMPPSGAAGAAGGEEAAPAPQTFDTPGELLRALMPLLDAGTAGAEDAFMGASKSNTAPEPAGAPMPG